MIRHQGMLVFPAYRQSYYTTAQIKWRQLYLPPRITPIHEDKMSVGFRLQQQNPYSLKLLSYRRVLTTLPYSAPPRQYPSETAQTIDSVSSIFSNPCYFLLGICKTIPFLRKIHSFLIVNGYSGDLLCQTKLISLYGSLGHLRPARRVFDKIPHPDLYSYKVMIRWYYLNELHSDTVVFYKNMRKFLRESDDVVLSIVLKACCELGDIDEGKKVHCHIVKVGCLDSFVLTSLVDMYAKCEQIDSARLAFNEIEDGNVVSWTSLIAGYVQNGCPEEGLILFNRMREMFVEGNQHTLGSLVTGCGKLGVLHQGRWLHGYVIKTGMHLNTFLATALLDMYVKCGSVDDARSIFDEHSATDLVSWTAMIAGYTKNGQPEEALKLFVNKSSDGILPNSTTAASLLSACGQLGDLRAGRMVHCLAVQLCLRDAGVQNALVDMYAKCRMLGDALYIFESILDRDVVAWNSMISGYAQNGHAIEALQLFHRMRRGCILPDAVTLVSAISACSSIGPTPVGSSLHSYLIRAGMTGVNPYIGTALLNFYAKCGDTVSARTVFDEMGEKNSVTWSAMISGYGMYGDGDESLALFSDMLRENLKPNDVIFTTVLSACSHSGKVGEGWRCFNSMCQEYNFVPSMKHYACMVDILSRAAKIEEAFEFMQNMPIRPDVTVLGAFLHGCGLHSRFDLGEIAAKRMLDLHPDDACYYVLLCKLYALQGKWHQGDQVRILMKQRGLSKSAGWSAAEMDGGEECCSLRVASAT